MNGLSNKWIEISSNISLIFVFTGLLSIFRCLGEFHKGNVETADYGLGALILLLSALLLCIGLILLHVILKNLDLDIRENEKKSEACKLLWLYWYPYEYRVRRNDRTASGRIRHYIGILIAGVTCVGIVTYVFLYLESLSLLEIVIDISFLELILIQCRKHLI